MNSHDHHSAHHMSRVDIPCLLYGTVGVGLALALHAVGLYKIADKWLVGILLDPVFHGESPPFVSLLIQIGVSAVFCYGIAFVVLDTAGTWRRVLIGVTVIVLALAMVPTLAVWQIYFSPFLLLVGVFWAWFCTMMYVSHHLMPCDIASSARIASPARAGSQKQTATVISDAADQQVLPENKADDSLETFEESEVVDIQEVNQETKQETKQDTEEDWLLKYQPKDEVIEKDDAKERFDG